MQWNREVAPVSVEDVDRAKAFSAERVGFHLDLDVRNTVVLVTDLDGNTWVIQERPSTSWPRAP